MRKNKHPKKTSDMTLDQFKTRLKNGHYIGLAGCKRAITRMQLQPDETTLALKAANRAFPGG